MHTLTRRQTLIGLTAISVTMATLGRAQAPPSIHVVKGRGCACCNSWVEYLRVEGFAVTAEERYPGPLVAYKQELGIPQEAFSCHTAIVEGYVLEGHVPAADINRLLADRPDAIGLAVPGMPYGSPGMGPEESRQAYDVLLIRRDGSTEVFSHYAAA